MPDTIGFDETTSRLLNRLLMLATEKRLSANSHG